MNSAATHPGEAIICSDFNVHFGNTHSTAALNLANLLDNAGFVQHVTSATHVSGNILDLIITHQLSSMIASSARSTYLITDHHVVAVTTQSTEFAPIEETLTSALVGLSEYYTSNQLRANPTKTQVSLFHLRNRECGKQLKISWNGVNLTHCNLPVYLGVTLDRTLSYKAHIEKTKKKAGTRNNIIRKLRNSKWGATPTTLRSSALALCYSAAEYACPVWERSTHAKKLNATLNETCRMITGCLKPTNINSLPILAGIAPSDIRRAVASRTERTRQTMDERHPLNGHLGVVPRLKSRKSFIKCTEPINTTAKAVRLEC